MDHAFIGCATGAPEGDALLRLGFAEGSRNTHPGQGTANRRFFFENFMLELVWVADQAEAQNDRTRRTRLWERCQRADDDISPFGIIFRSSVLPPPAPPFATWSYAPRYLAPGLTIQIAEGTSLYEPELFYLPFLRRATMGAEPVEHTLPIRRIKALSVGLRSREQLSEASLSAEKHGLMGYFVSPQPLLEILFDGPDGMRIDLRPDLPLVFRGHIRESTTAPKASVAG